MGTFTSIAFIMYRPMRFHCFWWNFNNKKITVLKQDQFATTHSIFFEFIYFFSVLFCSFFLNFCFLLKRASLFFCWNRNGFICRCYDLGFVCLLLFIFLVTAQMMWIDDEMLSFHWLMLDAYIARRFSDFVHHMRMLLFLIFFARTIQILLCVLIQYCNKSIHARNIFRHF